MCLRYVDLYVKYILEDSICEQYNAFHIGFYQVRSHHFLIYLEDYESLCLCIIFLACAQFDKVQWNRYVVGQPWLFSGMKNWSYSFVDYHTSTLMYVIPC